jgi:hypothetical protein
MFRASFCVIVVCVSVIGGFIGMAGFTLGQKAELERSRDKQIILLDQVKDAEREAKFTSDYADKLLNEVRTLTADKYAAEDKVITRDFQIDALRAQLATVHQ